MLKRQTQFRNQFVIVPCGSHGVWSVRGFKLEARTSRFGFYYICAGSRNRLDAHVSTRNPNAKLDFPITESQVPTRHPSTCCWNFTLIRLTLMVIGDEVYTHGHLPSYWFATGPLLQSSFPSTRRPFVLTAHNDM